MSKRQWVKGGAILAGGGLAVVILVMAGRTTSLGDGAFWQRQTSPGRLSAAHAGRVLLNESSFGYKEWQMKTRRVTFGLITVIMGIVFTIAPPMGVRAKVPGSK